MTLGPLADLPDWYWDVPYVGEHSPGRVGRVSEALKEGANCQLWAYAVLAHFGFVVGDLRSDELWYDTTTTQRVEHPLALDLVLYNGGDNPYGAHVGLWTGDAVAHLCANSGGQPSGS